MCTCIRNTSTYIYTNIFYGSARNNVETYKPYKACLTKIGYQNVYRIHLSLVLVKTGENQIYLFQVI